jgi:transposase InsO family protein
LDETIEKYGAPAIFNTDQESQYTSEIYTKALKNRNVKISMDGKGRPIDNIFIERLWRALNMKMYIYKVIRMGLHFIMDLKNILISIMNKDSISH